MEIKEYEFIKSSARVSECPSANLPEYAFIGRSNVGKSSLINMLVGNKKLAKISSTPGKTQLINHFLINKSWYLVDLPGIGYAKISKKERSQWRKLINHYLTTRSNLFCTFYLIDSRHSPQKIDLEFMQWLSVQKIPFVMVFTKTDKIKIKKIDEQIQNYCNIMLESWASLPKTFSTSVKVVSGKDSILSYISETNGLFQ